MPGTKPPVPLAIRCGAHASSMRWVHWSQRHRLRAASHCTGKGHVMSDCEQPGRMARGITLDTQTDTHAHLLTARTRMCDTYLVMLAMRAAYPLYGSCTQVVVNICLTMVKGTDPKLARVASAKDILVGSTMSIAHLNLSTAQSNKPPSWPSCWNPYCLCCFDLVLSRSSSAAARVGTWALPLSTWWRPRRHVST